MIIPTFENIDKILDTIVKEEALRLIKQKIEEGLGHKIPDNIALCFGDNGKILFIPKENCDIWELRRLEKELSESIESLEHISEEEARKQCSGIWIA